MKLDYYRLAAPPTRDAKAVLDLEHELPQKEAVALAKCGDVILVRVWLRTDGRAVLDELEQRIRAAVEPLGLK